MEYETCRYIYVKCRIIMSLLIQQPIKNSFELLDLARRGVPKMAVLQMAKQLRLTGKELTLIINLSERTLQRYDDNKNLEKDASERAIQLAALYERGYEVWGNEERFHAWMRHPNAAMDAKKPIELLDTLLGFQLVFDEIGRIEHGILA
jgi:putative toxin-antitoxin system antitoxin component (TIGR02293 family)